MTARWSDLKEPFLGAINLELTNHCNFKCSFCLNGKKNFRKEGFIANETIRKITTTLPGKTALMLCGIGEPCLHPDFSNIVDVLSSYFENISIVTNGTLFEKENRIKAVLSSNIKKIFFSLDYMDQESLDQHKKVLILKNWQMGFGNSIPLRKRTLIHLCYRSISCLMA